MVPKLLDHHVNSASFRDPCHDFQHVFLPYAIDHGCPIGVERIHN